MAPKRARDAALPTVTVKGRYMRLPLEASYVRPQVPSSEPIDVSETGFDAGGAMDWAVTRVRSGKLGTSAVRDRALLMISDVQVGQLLAGASKLPLKQPLPSFLGGGQFAENIFASGNATAKTLCVGDVLAATSTKRQRGRGAAGAQELQPLRLQVSSPRRPCSKIDVKLGKTGDGNGVRAHAARTGSSGWFVRVLAPGTLRDGDTLSVVERPHPDWTLERVSSVLYGPAGVCDDPKGYALPSEPAEVEAKWGGRLDELRELAALPELAAFEYGDEARKLLAVVDGGRGAWQCAVQ